MNPSLDDAPGWHHELVQRQMSALRTRIDGSFEESKARLATHMERGARTWRSVVETTGITGHELNACFALAAQDSRFEFLNSMPHAVTVGSAVAEALERGIFGDSSEDVLEISSLVQIFSLLLDGLIDEAPDVFDQDRESLFDLVSRKNWAADQEAPYPAQPGNIHPVVGLLLKITRGWVGRTKASHGWLTDPYIREELPAAVEAAILAEFESSKCRFGADIGLDSCRTSLREKGSKAMWVTALVPLVARGRPNHVDHGRYQESAHLAGEYLGWIDDIHDLLEDTNAGIWSVLLIDIYEFSHHPANLPHNALRQIMFETLAEEAVRDALVQTGVKQYDQLVNSLRRSGIDAGPVIQLIEDATLYGAEN